MKTVTKMNLGNKSKPPAEVKKAAIGLICCGISYKPKEF
jgi:hypothetical protein